MGDVLITKDLSLVVVLEVGASGKTFLPSCFSSKDDKNWETSVNRFGWYHIEDCKRFGWTIKQTTPKEEKPEEVTLAQVCEKFGKKVVIKKEE